MTPRHADVAFVLEPVGAVSALYAIEPGYRAAAYFDFAVELAHGGRSLADAHYALLRVMTHEECARVYLFHTAAPSIIAEAARPLRLTDSDRQAARSRVPPPPPREDVPPEASRPPAEPSVLIVDDDEAIANVVGEALELRGRQVVATTVAVAVKLADDRSFDLILCDAQRAFGKDGLLAKLPLDVASRVLVLARPSEVANARRLLQGTERVLTKPLEAWLLRERITRAGAVNLLWPRDIEKLVTAERPRPRLTCPPTSAAFSVLLADLDDDVHEALRRICREEARHVMRRDPEEAAELALSAPFHVLVCSAKAALHPRSFLDGIAREDPAGADRVLVIAPARDVPYVKHKLEQMGRSNMVLAVPIDDTLLRREVFRDHPSLATRIAVSEVAGANAPRLSRLRSRRLAALVVDDDQTTQMLFAAARPHDDADVALATSPMAAFEHVMSRPVDVLFVSATMRGDGGEPLYRVLWRLKPELKSRSVLVIAPAAVPPSAPPSAPKSSPPRVVERPLTRDAIGSVVDAFARS